MRTTFWKVSLQYVIPPWSIGVTRSMFLYPGVWVYNHLMLFLCLCLKTNGIDYIKSFGSLSSVYAYNRKILKYSSLVQFVLSLVLRTCQMTWQILECYYWRADFLYTQWDGLYLGRTKWGQIKLKIPIKWCCVMCRVKEGLGNEEPPGASCSNVRNLASLLWSR